MPKKASRKKTTALNESPSERRVGNRTTEERGVRTEGGDGHRTATAPGRKRISRGTKAKSAATREKVRMR